MIPGNSAFSFAGCVRRPSTSHFDRRLARELRLRFGCGFEKVLFLTTGRADSSAAAIFLAGIETRTGQKLPDAFHAVFVAMMNHSAPLSRILFWGLGRADLAARREKP